MESFADWKRPSRFALCFWIPDSQVRLFRCERWPLPSSSRLAFADQRRSNWLPEPNATAQVERTVFELTKNVAYYLQRHNDARVRRLHLEPASWSTACTQARDKMLHFLSSVPELADVKSGLVVCSSTEWRCGRLDHPIPGNDTLAPDDADSEAAKIQLEGPTGRKISLIPCVLALDIRVKRFLI